MWNLPQGSPIVRDADEMVCCFAQSLPIAYPGKDRLDLREFVVLLPVIHVRSRRVRSSAKDSHNPQ
jgi:hypothetical protein